MIIILNMERKLRHENGPKVLWLVLIALIVAGCGAAESAAGDETLRVVATTTMLGDLAQNVVGDQGEVEILLPIGADPHDYRASSRQVAAINEADLVITNGLGLEEGLEDVLDGAAADGANIVALGERLDPIPFAAAADHDESEAGDHEAEHEHGSDDPHIWLDPVRMARGARVLGEELESVAPGGGWKERAAAYAEELEALDTTIAELLAPIPAERRKIVANHSALGYFAARYDFELIGTVIPGGSTLGDPSSAELAELVETIEREGVGVVFAETTEPSALAEAVAGEAGYEVKVVDLYTGSLGEEGSGAETLAGMLLTNAELIAEALS